MTGSDVAPDARRSNNGSERWREAFERWREDGVGVGRAARRLVELRKRQRRTQFEAARPLLFCDADGGPQGFFG